MTKYIAVIGKNFGDEGKGLTVNNFSTRKTMVVRHNGGAQSGHTVETPDARFVFHEIGAGSFQGASTYWADTYHPDLYKLADEIAALKKVCKYLPRMYADPHTEVTLLDDIVINMARETKRGANRHGSCGMGIRECVLRGEAGYGLTIAEVRYSSEIELYNRICEIREKYYLPKYQELGAEPLGNAETVYMVEKMKAAAKGVDLIDGTDLRWLFNTYDNVIFESGQGLLLDEHRMEYFPHLTSSSTGLDNPLNLLERLNLRLDEVIYVTRTYVTRHGAGRLDYECSREELHLTEDMTNVTNEWQGTIRYAPHGTLDEFCRYAEEDLRKCKYRPKVSLMITHINETDGDMITAYGRVKVEDYVETLITSPFKNFYFSDNRYGCKDFN